MYELTQRSHKPNCQGWVVSAVSTQALKGKLVHTGSDQ